MYVVEHYRHAVAWRFGKPNIAWDDGFKDLGTEKAAEVGGNLLRQRGAVVVHGKKDAFDRERRIDRSAKAHEGIEELRNAFERQILALYRNHDRVTGSERVYGEQVE